MKLTSFSPLVFGMVLLFAPLGCKKAPTNATKALQQSFQSAKPKVKQDIDKVTTNLKAGKYLQAARALMPIVTNGQPLTLSQQQAVSIALGQINRAVDANPKLQTKEMYEMRQRLFRAVRRPPQP